MIYSYHLPRACSWQPTFQLLVGVILESLIFQVIFCTIISNVQITMLRHALF